MVKFEILKCVIFLTSKIIFISGTNTCLLCTLIFVGPMACMSIHKIQQYPGMYPQGRPVRPRSHLNIQIPYPYPPQRGQILPTIAEVASKFLLRLRPWYLWSSFTLFIFDKIKLILYSHIFNKRGGGAKVAKSLNVEVGI